MSRTDGVFHQPRLETEQFSGVTYYSPIPVSSYPSFTGNPKVFALSSKPLLLGLRSFSVILNVRSITHRR